MRLKNGSTPVNNVWVRISGDSLLSDGLGLAKFLQLPINEDYSYSTFREGYVDKVGEFYLTTDTTIDVAMAKVPNAIEIKGSTGNIRIWPNPTSSSLQIELPDDQKSMVTIHDVHGARVLKTNVYGPLSRIDMSPFPAGVYSVSVSGGPPSLIIKH